MELQQQKKRDQEEAQYSDNNFWRIQTAAEADADVDELLRELEDGERPGQASGEPSTQEEGKNEGESSLQEAGEEKPQAAPDEAEK